MPDGKAIIFSAVRSDKARKLIPEIGIFRVDLITSEVIEIVKNAQGPAIDPAGKRMAYTKLMGPGFQSNSDIYLYDFKTRMEQPLVADTLRESAPSWSPDGKKIVYSVLSNMANGMRFANLDLFVIDLSAGETKQITESSGFKNYNPEWAPSGNKITYYLEKGDNRDQIYLTDENGSFHDNLTADTSTHNFYPSWIGKQILFTRSPGKIFTMDENGGQKSILEGLPAFWAKYNKTTDKIAFLSQGSRTNPSQLMIFDMKTKQSYAPISKETLEKLVF
jgi:Tol biopolymer transport system component